jgi:hypothetical protein
MCGKRIVLLGVSESGTSRGGPDCLKCGERMGFCGSWEPLLQVDVEAE